ncbi:MAG: acyl-CoA synthetase [Janthinobacterium lividum]
MFDMPKTSANYAPLSPISFMKRSAAVFPDRVAIIHGPHRQSWGETGARCRRLASALAQVGVRRGDTVAIIAPNTPAMVEAHFGVPMAGGILNAINTRLDPATIAYILDHGGARVLLVDREFAPVIREALALQEGAAPVVVDILDPLAPENPPCGGQEYESFLAGGDPAFEPVLPQDEWDAIALNYTSGTTGKPKGVVYHHRGAYLGAVGNAMTWGMAQHPVYLWTLPMFHCNGWTFPWTIAAMAGVNVCLRRVEASAILHEIAANGITHMCGAPIVLGMVLNSKGVQKLAHPVKVMTAGAAPPAAVLEGMGRLGFDITHVYGLTECYGPMTVCAWDDAWDALPDAERAAVLARQGVNYPVQEDQMVADPATMLPVPQDGTTMGEIMMRGNVVMKGYLKNPAATDEAFAGGWFHTGDLAVWHKNGYAEIRDRAKDIIISGGENISTIEIEDVLYRHPAVMEAAVVARPDDTWGETPCAFITLKPDAEATEAEIIAFCRERMARYKAPRTVVFGPLPKTSTGKMQKFMLREQARAL